MRKLFKIRNLPKVIVAAMFVVAMGFGMSTSLSIFKNNGNSHLLALSSAVAQGEGGPIGLSRYHSATADCFPGSIISFRRRCTCSYSYCTDVLTNCGKKPKS